VFPDDPAATVGIILILLLALSWHEAAHAWVADRLGDPTARMLGRVTLNPLKHLDPFLSVILPAMMFYFAGVAIGGGKPVPINVMNFRHRARDFMLVALAGPGSNLLLAAFFALLFVVSSWMGWLGTMTVTNPYGEPQVFTPTFSPWNDYTTVSELWLKVGVLVNLGLAAFNLLPIPPLDGSRVIGWMLPRPIQPRWYALDRLGFLVIIVLFFGFGGFKYIGTGLVMMFDGATIAIDTILDLKPLV
jgi:Zn-dependent protease